MLTERQLHSIGHTVSIELPSHWPIPRHEPGGASIRIPIPGTAGAFEVRVYPASEHTPEDFLILHATAVRHRWGVPTLDLDVDDRDSKDGVRKLTVEFDVASYVWRSVLLVGEGEWVLASAVVPRASAETLFARFEGLLRCVKFGARAEALSGSTG